MACIGAAIPSFAFAHDLIVKRTLFAITRKANGRVQFHFCGKFSRKCSSRSCCAVASEGAPMSKSSAR